MEKDKKNEKKDDIRLMVKEIAVIPQLILRKLKPEFSKGPEITPTQISVLLTLRARNEPIRMNELASQMMAHMPVMTGIINKLVGKNLVERGGDPNDRRVVTVRLTSSGEKLAKELYETIEEIWTNLLSELKEKERRDFLRLAMKLRKILEREVAP